MLSMPGRVQATMIEKLDGLPFAFGAKSFRQARKWKWRFNTHADKEAIRKPGTTSKWNESE